MYCATALILWTVAVYQTVTFSNAAGCSTKADVTFVLDSSDTVGQTNFAKQLNFVKNTVNNLDVGRDKVRISTVTFSSGVHNQFFLNNYDTKANVMNAVSGIQYLPGSTDTSDALKYVTQTSFTPQHGGRGGIPHIMVLVTDGPSITRDITKLQAQTAKDNNIAIYTVGVGHGIDMDELKSVSSDPDSRYLLTADNYDSLGSLSELLATKMCNEVPGANVLPPATGCLQKADLVFMVDSSSTVGNLNLEKTENFIKNFVTKLNVGKNAVHVGLEQYGSRPSSEFALRMYDNRYDVLKAIHGMQLMGGGTNTGDAIEFAKTTMFSPAAGARSNVPRIAIMVTDGGTSETTAAINQANEARLAHISMIGVGVGGLVNMNELNSIADKPSASHVITVRNYDELESISNQLMTMTCGVQTSINFFQNYTSCTDKVNNCQEYGSRVCTDYKQWSEVNCRSFCQICSYKYSVTETCVDQLSNCATYGKSSCTSYKQWAQDNCKQYCGFCTSAALTGGFYNRCAYKGKSYSPGQKWYDGCDYECVCQDGATGRYQCYNRCPVYYNLPSMCTLVRKPGECCLQPVCNFKPAIQKFESSGKGQNQFGIDVCVYKGKQYYQDQSWTDGCDYQCTCTAAKTGLYQCEQLCPSFSVLPQICHLEQTPGQCCKKPICEFTQQAGTFTGNGMISGSGVNLQAPFSGPCLDLVTCSNYGSDVCTTYKDWAMKNCKNTCNFCPSSQVSGPNDRCVYDGKSYKQGEVWSPKCDERCSCENAKYGYYRCVNTCPSYTNLPSGCNLNRRNGECCLKVQCTNGVFLQSATSSYSLGGGGGIQIISQNGNVFPIPTLAGGYVQGGGSGTGMLPPTIDGCLYNGQVYSQNQAWMDGCAKYCVCVDATKGQMSCRARCPKYTNMSPTCVMSTDTNDPCCSAPKCTFDANLGRVPQPLPAFGQSALSYSVVSPNTGASQHNGYGKTIIPLFNTAFTPAPPTVDPGKMSAGGYCDYGGKRYNVGQKWDVGCHYNCICDDGTAGHYTCVEKCVHYSNLPQGCFLIQDAANPCCKVPRCSVPPQYEIVTGVRTTPSARTGVCTYKEQYYQQGQTWYDGCSYRCTCEDAEKGIYRCLSRCPEYPLSHGSECTLVSDPRDPTCCQMRVCGIKNGTSGNNSPNPTPARVPPAVYHGIETNFQGKSGVCIYKGQAYKQGDIWQDGCDYTCTCDDEIKGAYSCTDRCPVYINLQPGCEMVRDFSNPCCKKPQCTVTGPPPTRIYHNVPNLPVTLKPELHFCVYKGVRYLQGQEWEDGCSFKCRCDDSSRGIYTCNQRCASIDQNLQAGCTLRTDPRDACCLAQFCVQTTPVPQPGVSYEPTPVPTLKPNTFTGKVYLPTPSPIPGQPTPTPAQLGVCIYKGRQYSQGQTFEDGCDFDCVCFNANEGKYRCSPKCPVYTDIPNTCRLVKNPRKPCCQIPECYNLPTQNPTGQPTPSPLPYTGQPTPSPTPYTGQPTQGPTPYHGQPTPSPTPYHGPPTPSPKPYTGQPTQPPHITPQHIPQRTVQPTQRPTPQPQPTQPINVCVYKGIAYSQGQQWYDGCDYSCVCEDGITGVYRCNNRCPTFAQQSDPTCTLQPDPTDPLCCKVPVCTPIPGQTPPPGQTFPPYQTQPPKIFSGGVATPAPTPRTTQRPNVNVRPNVTPTFYPPITRTYRPGETPAPTPYPLPTQPKISTPSPQPTVTQPPIYKTNYCIYKGKTYSKGQKWQDGCQYDCMCLDDLGNYRCTEKCPTYSNLQPGCRLIMDYSNPCCQKPYCPPPTSPNPLTLTPPTPKVFVSTQKPTYCVYNGVQFKQGQTWNDGCDLRCICEDSMTGFYRCDDRCPQWPQLPQGCSLTTDPNDVCCKKPICTPEVMTPPTLYVPTPNPTSYPNQPTPSPQPTQPPTPYTFTLPTPIKTGYSENCMYKGVAHTQGQKWDDGCSLECECMDQKTGRYRCSSKCQDYSNFPRPSYCHLVSDPRNPCCKVVQCNPVVTPRPTPQPTPRPTLQPNQQTVSPPLGQTNPPTLYPGQPTQKPPVVVTQAPHVNPTQKPKPNPQFTQPTPSPTPHVCVYKGVPYTQGQQWYDGCDKVCTCENGMTGYVRCRQRCTTYDTIPAGCTMVPDPNDPVCCQIPSCIPQNQTPGPSGSPVIFTAPTGKVTGYGTVTPQPTPGPTFRPNVVNTLAPNPLNTLQPGQPGTGPTQSPQIGITLNPTPSTKAPTPAPRPNYCVYNGVQYKTGQKWQDGCKYNCVCENGMTGFYTCSERCPTFPAALPPTCSLTQDSKDFCCKTVVCDSRKTTPFVPYVEPTQAPTYNPLAPSTTPGTYAPSQKITLSPNPTPPAYCVYYGVPYKQGQTWNQGCEKRCRCDDASNNYYTCFDRCPSYPNLPSGCTRTTDPNDVCCQIPFCPSQAPNPVTYSPQFPYTGAPTLAPSPYTGVPTLTPSPTPYTGQPTPKPTPYTGVPTLAPFATTPKYQVPTLPQGVIVGGSPSPNPQLGFTNAPSKYCEYKGVRYTTGQRWRDGCDYNCVCVDGMSGVYQCSQRCPKFPQLPAGCIMVTDQNDACCLVPDCPKTPAPTYVPTRGPGQTLNPTPTPGPGETPSPQPTRTVPFLPNPNEVCVYKGKTYTQGQAWYDGCDMKCVCVNGMTGVYTCSQRCSQYDQNPNCVLIPDPSDPECCKKPQCTSQNTNPPVIVGTNPPRPPVYLTFGPGQTINGGTRPTVPAPEVCIYNGRQYTQGQKWQDGCKYTCECVNAKIGMHKCIQRCADMSMIPPTCQMKYNPMDPCCPLPDCPNLYVTPIPGTNRTIQPPTLNPLMPQPKYCVYNGVPYTQGQTFNVGCEKKCICDDASTGHINCNDRCPTYPPLSDGCQLLTDPNDQCCQAPLCVDTNPKTPFQVITAPKGSYTGGNQPQIGPNSQIPHLSTGKACTYGGQIYRQGQKWKDGCLFECECFDEATGRYRCTEVCPRHPQVPSYCTLVQDPNNDCCQAVYCPLQPTNQPQPYTGTPTQAPQPYTGAPTQRPTPGQYVTPKPTPMCVYNGVAYRQGQQWYDGCDLTCRCENAMKGYYRCQQRCNRYDSLPQGCTLVADPSDPQCCKVPQCQLIPQNATPQPGIFTPPVPVFGSFTGSAPNPTPQPTPSPTMRLPNGQIVVITPQPGLSTQAPPTPTPGCFYKGRSFTQGQKWADGCKYVCECVNDMIGQYKCTERCQNYPNLPTYCTLIQNPKDSCCPVPYCDKVNPTPSLPATYQPYVPTTHSPLFVNPGTNPPMTGQQTPSPFGKAGYCVYNGVYYRQGQTWVDGCDKRCRCDDVTTGLYSCTQRCPIFNNIPSTCSLVADNNDPCCTVPQCNIFPSTARYTGSGTPPTTARPMIIVPTPVKGGLTGEGTLAPNNPLYNQFAANGTGYCAYKGKIYSQGQRWDDGCDYTCQCIDALRGRYKCDYRCPQYYNLPAYCHYEQDPSDTCCRKPKCDPSQTVQPRTTPSIYNNLGPTIAPNKPKPTDMCIYKDRTTHAQGSSWDDGCDLHCTCENATMNIYQCQAKCKLFQQLPSQCSLVRDPVNRCCYVPRCVATGTNIPLNPYYNTYNGSSNVTPQPGKLNVIPVGQYSVISGNNWQKPQGSVFTGVGGFGACVYKNVVYKQGQSWDDGCDYVCTCADASKGQYNCVSKCPQLPNPLPSYCQKISIPGQCCVNVKCDIPGVSYKPPSEILATAAPTNSFGLITNRPGIIMVGTPKPTETPALPGNGFPILQQQFSQVRSQCIFHKKEADGKPEKFLVYNQGEKWNDGCEFSCQCMDGKTGYYYCDPLCPVYNNLPSNKCYLTRVDGQCCNQPRCQLDNGKVVNPLQTQTKYTIIGTLPNGYTGFGPNYNFSSTLVGGNYQSQSGGRNVCIYKGKIYKQGQQWSDGCDFDCRCDDASRGAFSCTPRCPTYTSLPSFCELKKSDRDCCARPVCHKQPVTLIPPTTTTALPTRPTCSWCNDALDNCKSYGQSACEGAYKPWARRNCAHYCNFCDCSAAPTTTVDPFTDPTCIDKLDNCGDFGDDACTGIFYTWALDNCARHCGLCNALHSTVNSNRCEDKQATICNSQKDVICTNAAYTIWAKDNCQKTCDLCPGQVRTTPTPKGCTFNGVAYQHSAQWKDGCDKNCTCVNGLYNCVDICPKYPNLPPNWQLVKSPGECCPHVVIGVGEPVCNYGGKEYRQDETWSDGCQFSCVCNDAKAGQYQCKEKCPVWHLPDVCTWLPAKPGKCCRQPTCPKPYVITGYPDA
ncbi:uncharacterized protein LOC143080130 isoform X2 [Mytilus galloprovincialis]|uniref:uncharacterized protein LOC143080130 isoform X2 n=1 Tax=Mytilus galloprovincialis TaxID=29158 RepID=UPI003F7C7B28